MHKLSLNLDDLRVETFEPSPAGPGERGTIKANESDEWGSMDSMDAKCYRLPQATWDQSCMIGTCGASCQTCGYTCPGTCAYTCGCNFTDLCSSLC
ncbi:MAG TPA: hypothetical protein VJU82_00285 [Acidobacteriaceae bacterium]|nr:hypothetical protein [Acidobacteriaceae bacterium]